MLSSRARLATRALLDLSLHEGEGPIQIVDVADRQRIPLKYLQQILLSLKAEGWVESRKGPGGGYLLACKPSEITLAAVWRAIDGAIAPMGCASVYFFQECGCPEPETCSLRRAFLEVREAMAAILETTTFEDLKATHGKAIPGVSLVEEQTT